MALTYAEKYRARAALRCRMMGTLVAMTPEQTAYAAALVIADPLGRRMYLPKILGGRRSTSAFQRATRGAFSSRE